jgi:hypothetical protein
LTYALSACDGTHTDSRGDFTVESGSTADMAAGVSNGAGKVSAAADGSSGRTVVVFEESHGSRLGQLEIALMMVRLHDKHGLRQVSLEGAMFDKGALPAKWFHDVTSSPQARRAGRETAVRLLKEGEVSAAEFIALTLPDVQVRGNERADEYDVKLSDQASGASTGYLIAIAEKSLSQSQIEEANRLMRAGKEKEAVEGVLKGDEWVQARYQKLTSEEPVLSTEELTALLEEIEAKANSVGAEIGPEERAGFREEINFFKMGTQRSKTMVANTLGMFGQGERSTVALDIGAAHASGVVGLLKEGKASYALIAPNSLAAASHAAELTRYAYGRKNLLKSVDAPGLLGAYLDGRHKPPPGLGEQRRRSKAEAYLASRLLADAASGGEKPPFKSLEGEFNSFQSIKIDPSAFRLLEVNGEPRVMFKFAARYDDNDPSRTIELRGGTWNEKDVQGTPPGPDEVSLEQLVQEAIDEVKREEPAQKEPTADSGEVEQPAKSTLLPISRKTRAVFSTQQAAVDNVVTGG